MRCRLLPLLALLLGPLALLGTPSTARDAEAEKGPWFARHQLLAPRGERLDILEVADTDIDTARRRIFLAGGLHSTGDGSVKVETAVRDLDTGVERVLPGLAGAFGLLVDEEGDRLFVTLMHPYQLAVVSLRTLKTVATHDLEEPPAPLMAMAGGRLWFAQGWGGLHALDPDTGDIVRADLVGFDDWSETLGSPLAVDPRNPRVMLVQNLGGHYLYRVRVAKTGGKVRMLALKTDGPGDGIHQAAYSPSGDAAYLTWSASTVRLDPDDLTTTQVYNTGYERMVTVTDRGRVVVADYGHGRDDVWFYEPDQDRAYLGYEFDRGISYVPDSSEYVDTQSVHAIGSHVYIVSSSHHQPRTRLRILDSRHVSPARLRVRPVRAVAGDDGRLVVTTPKPGLRVVLRHRGARIAKGWADRHGRFVLRTTLRSGRYEAHVAGTARHQPAKLDVVVPRR